MVKQFFPAVLFLCATFSAAADIDYSRYAVEKDMVFGVYLEQNGETRDAHAGTVILEKAPFTLVLVLKEPAGILVNFSLDDRLYRGFRMRKTLADILDEPDLFMGIAEDNFNPRRRIFIDDIAPHFLFFQDEENHRFDAVFPFGNYLICKRTVGYYTFLSDLETIFPIERLPGRILYLSLFYGDYDDNWERVELQKTALQIDFE